MNVIEHTRDGVTIAEVSPLDRPIDQVGTALDVLASAQHAARTNRVVLYASSLHDSFFDLSSGLAGEILQKVSNYGMRLAIVGDFAQSASGALRDFMRESNEYGQVVFVPDVETAVSRLAS